MTLTIYHNPRCSKSRAALALLEERGLQTKVIRYLETPPTAKELKTLLARLGMRPRELLRKGEAEYEALGLADTSLGDKAILEAMARHPVLIERPIVVNGDRAVVARPPERALDIV